MRTARERGFQFYDRRQVPRGKHALRWRDQRRRPNGANQASRSPVLAIGLGVLGLLTLAGVFYWLAYRNIESTDDAYTDGRSITIAPRVSGAVVSLDVNDNQFVKKGQPLIHIDPRQYLIDKEQAEGALETAKHQLAGLQLMASRSPARISRRSLSRRRRSSRRRKPTSPRRRPTTTASTAFPKQATTQQEVDAALAALKQAQAQVMLQPLQVTLNSPVPQRIGETDAQVGPSKGQIEQAQARLDQANLNLSWTVVEAPQDGWITKRNVEAGNYVTPGQQLFIIVAPETWVTANFKESQLAYMRPGQAARIKVDAYPSLDLHGHVDSVQLGSGSKFSAFPVENATGNFVKVVQRVPVKIVIDSGLDPENSAAAWHLRRSRSLAQMSAPEPPKAAAAEWKPAP